MILAPILGFAQQPNKKIQELWKSIEHKEEQREVQSMLPEVQEVISLSRQSKAYASLLKGMFYEAKINITTQEDKAYDINTVLQAFEAELKAASGEYKAVLQAYIARLYQLYYEENAYKLSNRTTVEQQKGNDIRFWTKEDFERESAAYWNAALETAKKNTTATVGGWNDVFLTTEQYNLDFSKLTVYEALRIDYAAYLAEGFAYRATTEQREQKKAQAKEVVQQVIQELTKKGQSELAAYVQVYALHNFEHHQELAERNKVYQTLLKQNPKSALVHEAVVQFMYYAYQDSQEQEVEETAGATLLAFIEQTIAKFPGTETAQRLETIKKVVETPSLDVSYNAYELPEVSSILAVTHKNVSTLHFKILKFEGDDKSFSINEPSNLAGYKKIASDYEKVTEYTIALKSFTDYKAHTTHVELKPLPPGRYIVLLANRDFDYLTEEKDVVSMALINSTSNAFLTNGNKFRLYDRKTGQPKANQAVFLANGPKKDQSKAYWETIINTDGNGEFTADFIKEYANLYYGVKGESIFYSTYTFPKNKETEDGTETVNWNAKVLTDRAIYRPGQVVYFKSIVFRQKGKTRQVGANQLVTVKLMNQETQQEVGKLALKTNEFGSVQGEFILPTTGMLGSFNFEVLLKEGNIEEYASISVEEYKRPKFEVTMDEVKGVYYFDEKVEAKGKAIDYSGATVAHSTVNYRVVRNSGYRYDIRGYYGRPGREQAVTVAQGAVETDATGNFTITFTATPERKEYKATDLRVHSYTVYADVMDINGETHSSTQTIYVGDKNINLQLPITTNEMVSTKELEAIKIKTNNLNGATFAAKGELSIVALEAPYARRMLLPYENYAKEDYELYTYEEFVSKFPYVGYGDEIDHTKWKQGKVVFSKDFDTAKDSEVTFPNAKALTSGFYLLKGFVWEKGEKTEVEQYFYYDNTTEEPGVIYQLLSVKADKEKYKTGEVAKIRLQSGENQTIVIASVFVNGHLKQKKTLEVNRKASYFEYPMTGEMGDVRVSFTAVKHNFATQKSAQLVLDASQEELKVELVTFRDKLTPGQEETWRLKVSGKSKDKFAAEMVAGMYDASLDQFRSNTSFHTNFDYFFSYGQDSDFGTYNFSRKSYAQNLLNHSIYPSLVSYGKPIGLNVFGFSPNGRPLITVRGAMAYKSESANLSENMVVRETAGEAMKSDAAAPAPPEAKEKTLDKGDVQIRTNLKETAFFYPQLQTDDKGNVSFTFTTPEALTQWKFMAFAHTKNLQSNYVEQLVRTQKELMVQPNMPRFVREEDQITVSTKIVNLNTTALSGEVEIQFFDALTATPLTGLVEEGSTVKQNFTLAATANTEVAWTINVPKDIVALGYRIMAKAGEFSDGEEAAIPVLSGRTLVTETMPLYIKEGQNKLFTFNALEQPLSATRENYKLTLEVTANPMWTAILALPYLKEHPFKGTEQTFSKVFANTVATQLLNSNPRIQSVFEYWSKQGGIQSKLELNDELKQVLIEETPWVRQAADETEQMKRLAVLFDLNKMKTDLDAQLERLNNQQNKDGGFPWFSGDQSNVYITQTIVEGFGQMKQAGGMPLSEKIMALVKKAFTYLDEQHYATYQKNKNEDKRSTLDLHYLYVRSLFKDEIKIQDKYAKMIADYRKELAGQKTSDNLYTLAMKAIVLQRFGDAKAANSTVKTILETAVRSDEMGMYWKENAAGWLWYNAPIETQVMIIEAAHEVDATKYANAIEDMKVWLLKNKQTVAWNSTKATTRAVYALLYLGKNWMQADQGVDVKVGGYPVDFAQSEQFNAGYYKKVWDGADIQQKMGIVELDKKSAGVAYGAMYWQYFEDLNKVSKSGTGIAFDKQLFIKATTDSGQVLREITNETPIKVGDVVTVRLEISVDRDMDYVHLKDMRASGFEPMNVRSGYKRNGEFGYYEETRDAATNFFITHLRKGTYVFEYDLRANNAGYFSNGITTLQSVYAPEMNATSEGADVKILR
ncbi:alpha-2-macroglobulin family protein [Myroides sp. DF42-4-2]|uniref:alpha-2-macroglobulin family protein n=1 Tax=unclassified Myroides TaxID=2642485 RepID=UPI0025768087|nr:alpha-2-macroglobulin family protein [Myroides sp. DF42-4-2]MDM1407300.1 alpha-2-macroglobulin [Myroides sp. DF42-4-2]